MPEVLKRGIEWEWADGADQTLCGDARARKKVGWLETLWVVFGHACTVVGLGPIDVIFFLLVSKGKACNSNHRGFFFRRENFGLDTHRKEKVLTVPSINLKGNSRLGFFFLYLFV